LNNLKKEQIIFFKGNARVKAVLECARCLEEYACDLVTPIEILGVVSRPGEEGSRCDDGESIIRVPSGSRRIDLTDHIRSELLVLVPLKPLCQEGCKGLCPRCGANLNREQCSCQPDTRDSRWDALKKIK